jgi:type 1 glutamine amidotransferase
MLGMAWMAAAILALVAGPATAAADDEGFVSLFDGKTLEGWDGDQRFWRVDDGAIVGQTTPDNPTQGNTFLIWDKGEPADFELKFQYGIDTEWANSGIQVRSRRLNGHRVGGYQPDIAHAGWITGIMYEEAGRGVLARRGEKVEFAADGQKKAERFADENERLEHIRPGGEWNDYHVIAKGNRIVTKINGQTMHEVIDDAPQARISGLIAFQLHSGPPMTIRFRNIRLKEDATPSNPTSSNPTKKVVLIAGSPSHGYGGHEHYAGLKLLGKRLEASGLPIETVLHRDWPKEEDAFEGADTIVIFSDGDGRHPMLPHLDQVAKMMEQGVGLACLHFAVEVPKDRGGAQLRDWIGGYFEMHWSVNPFWTAEIKEFPDHPVAQGLRPFALHDEWYYHMRFVDDMQGVTPILTAIPPDSTRERGDGSRSGNPTVRARKGMPEHLMWVRERPDGGRGMGFTGGHYHWFWACDSFRTAVLNGIVWTAGLDVPEGGVPSKRPTYEELLENQDYDQPANFDAEPIKRQIEEWNQ